MPRSRRRPMHEPIWMPGPTVCAADCLPGRFDAFHEPRRLPGAEVTSVHRRLPLPDDSSCRRARLRMTKVPAHVRRMRAAQASRRRGRVRTARSGGTSSPALPHLPGVYRMLKAARARCCTSARRATSRSGWPRISRRPARWSRASSSWCAQVRAHRNHGDALRVGSAAAREQSHQDVLAPLQHSLPGRQVLSVSADHRPPRFRGWASTAAPLDKVNRYFGPFSSAGAVRESIQLMQKVFRCAPARTRCSATARGPACCTRSGAARRRASD